MEIKTAKVSGIQIAGSSIRVGGQVVMAANRNFRKALTSSVENGQEEADSSVEQYLDPAELLQYKKLPSWTRRRCQRLMESKKAKEEFWIEAGENVAASTAQHVRPPAGSNSPGRDVGEAGVAKAGNITWNAKKNMDPPGKAAWLAGENTSKAESAVWLAGKGSSKVGNAVWKMGEGAKKGTETAVRIGAAVSTAGTAAPVIAAKDAANGAVRAARMAKRTADHVRSSLAAVSAQEHMEMKLAAKERRKEEKNKKEKKNGGASKILLWSVLAAAALIFIIFINIFVALFTIPGQGAEKPEAHDIVEAARAELSVSDSNIGGYKYKQWYGMDDNWCAMFVSYCSDKCGYIDSGIMPKTASVSEMESWYRGRRLYHAAAGYVPMPGDIIFFGNGKSHTGIVIEFDPKEQVVKTIEGNTGSSDITPYHKGSRVKECRYAAGDPYIVGYASPQYPSEDSGTEEPTQPAEQGSGT